VDDRRVDERRLPPPDIRHITERQPDDRRVDERRPSVEERRVDERRPDDRRIDDRRTDRDVQRPDDRRVDERRPAVDERRADSRRVDEKREDRVDNREQERRQNARVEQPRVVDGNVPPRDATEEKHNQPEPREDDRKRARADNEAGVTNPSDGVKRTPGGTRHARRDEPYPTVPDRDKRKARGTD